MEQRSEETTNTTMLLKDITLFLNVDEYDRQYRSDFGFRSRYVCNFLTRRVRELKVRVKGFNRICIQGCTKAQEFCSILSNNILMVSVVFDQEQYEKLEPRQQHEFFINMLLDGLEICITEDNKDLLQSVKTALEDFRREDYKNEWIYKEKKVHDGKYHIYLLCALDSEKFVLTLRVEHVGEKVFEEPILKTKPDEIIYAHKFKDLEIVENAIVVKDKFGKVIFTLDLESLSL